MYVRWKRRTLQRPKYRGTTRQTADMLLSASLVESARIDGKPRQRTVKYLGSIQQWRVGQAAFYPLLDFWQGVYARLDTLTLSKKARREIENQIAAAVPKPTKAMRRESIERFSAAIKSIEGARG